MFTSAFCGGYQCILLRSIFSWKFLLSMKVNFMLHRLDQLGKTTSRPSPINTWSGSLIALSIGRLQWERFRWFNVPVGAYRVFYVLDNNLQLPSEHVIFKERFQHFDGRWMNPPVYIHLYGNFYALLLCFLSQGWNGRAMWENRWKQRKKSWRNALQVFWLVNTITWATETELWFLRFSSVGWKFFAKRHSQAQLSFLSAQLLFLSACWRRFWGRAGDEMLSSWSVWFKCPHMWRSFPLIHHTDPHWWRWNM